MAASLSALGAGLVEYLPPTFAYWMVLALYLPAAPTPLGRWTFYFGPFGVSVLLYLVNFSLWRDRTRRGLGRWLAPTLGATGLALAWGGGHALAGAIDVHPLPFRAMIIQPNLPPEDHSIEPPWMSLDRLTRGLGAIPRGGSDHLARDDVEPEPLAHRWRGSRGRSHLRATTPGGGPDPR